jgi:hypothetical protein
MEQFKLIYVMNDKPRQYLTRADDGFQAEQKFLEWANMLSVPVRVIRVERIVL